MARTKKGRIRLKLTGLKEVVHNLDEVKKEVAKELERITSQGAEVVLKEAEARVPVKEELLKSTLRVRQGKSDNDRKKYQAFTIVGTPAGQEEDREKGMYAPFIEYGRSGQPPQPFMRPAMEKGKRKVRKMFVDELKAIIRKNRGGV